MPIQDWRLVDTGIFHAFRHSWMEEIYRLLNGGFLPPDYYAMMERGAEGAKLNILRLQKPRSEVVIRHRSNHRIIAIIEIVSPGNKNNRHGIRSFIEKAVTSLRGGIHF